MWKAISWPYVTGATLRLLPARVAGGDNLPGGGVSISTSHEMFSGRGVSREKIPVQRGY